MVTGFENTGQQTGRFILAYNSGRFQPSIGTQHLVKLHGAYTTHGVKGPGEQKRSKQKLEQHLEALAFKIQANNNTGARWISDGFLHFVVAAGHRQRRNFSTQWKSPWKATQEGLKQNN